MNYPLISEYIDAIKSAKDNFEELSHLRPVLDASGIPVMSSGNFAVVFKMKSKTDGKLYAVKCFTKEQEGRNESYKLIAEKLESVTSDYLIPIKFYEKDLFVDTNQTDDTEFPVLLMDWVEGKTLDKYLRENIHDKYALEMLAYRFSQLASWLIPQPFAHGDLKPDNILVRDNGSLVLVDYDGMFVPSMKGQKARELGSPDFRHPQRTENDFDEHIDDFSIASILLSLKAIAINPQFLDEYGAADRLLLSEKDALNIGQCRLLKDLFLYNNKTLNKLIAIIILLSCQETYLCYNKSNLYINLSPLEEEKKSIVYKIKKAKDFSSDKPHVDVTYRKFSDSIINYTLTYDLRVIYYKECINNDGEFDAYKAYDLLTKELPIGNCDEPVYFFDIPIEEISNLKYVKERKTGKVISFIPIASYRNDKEHAISIAKERFRDKIKSKVWETCILL